MSDLDSVLSETFDGLSDGAKAAFDNTDLSFLDNDPDYRGPVEEPEEAAEVPEETKASNRDEKGRFKPKEAPAEEAPATEPPAEEQPAEPVVEPETPFPSSWKREHEEAWKALPPAVRQEVARRESDFHAELGKYKQATEYASQWVPIADQLIELRNTFGSEVQGVQKLLELSDFAGKNPREFVAWFCSAQGLDPSTVLQEAAKTVASQDPRVPQLQQELQALKQRAAEEEAARQRQINEQAVNAVEQFRQGKPDFDSLRSTMAQLVQAGIATDIETAYAKARALTQAANASSTPAPQATPAVTEPPPKPTEVNVPRTGAPPRPTGRRKGSMDDTLRELGERLFS